jgi:hypothetical protein
MSSQSAEPALSGLKARATLAWGNAPGHNRLTISGLKARAKCLIRNSQLHESKSSSVEDIFLPRFPPTSMSSPKTTYPTQTKGKSAWQVYPAQTAITKTVKKKKAPEDALRG